MSNDSIGKTVFVAGVLCLVCSVIVAGSAVLLKPIQTENRLLDKQKNILAAAGLLNERESVKTAFEKIETRLVNVSEGRFATPEELSEIGVTDVNLYDPRKAAKITGSNVMLSSEQDIASIKMRARYYPVYLHRDSTGKLDKIILPIHGYGLWSTLYGFVALKNDFNTVVGLGFYEHAETPGLGGEVDNPKWKALWPGKKIYDDQNNVSIALVKGNVDKSRPEAVHQVDALSGATLTSHGVSNLTQFWLGKEGFGPFLEKLRKEGV